MSCAEVIFWLFALIGVVVTGIGFCAGINALWKAIVDYRSRIQRLEREYEGDYKPSSLYWLIKDLERKVDENRRVSGELISDIAKLKSGIGDIGVQMTDIATQWKKLLADIERAKKEAQDDGRA